MTLPAPLAPMGAYRQFIRYALVPKADKPGKMDKVPLHWRDGYKVDLTNPTSWCSYDEAATSPHGHGVGFVFGDLDPFWFLDVDNALLPAMGDVPARWSDVALDLYKSLPGVAWELSQSGKGLHAFGTGSYPEGLKVKSLRYGIELYHAGRFVALTGNMWTDTGSAAALCPAIADVATRYLEPQGVIDTARRDDAWTTEPVADWDTALADDTVLIARARKSKTTTDTLGARDGKRRYSFEELWDGQVDDDDRSEAEQSFADRLAFWTGKNCERIESLMRQSALCRDKWDSHSTYLRNTILNACAYATDIAKPRPIVDMVVTDVAGERPLSTVTRQALAGPAVRPSIVGVDQLAGYFAGCVYVADRDAIFTPDGVFLKKSAFDGIYGGPSFVMTMDGAKPTNSAWEAFRLNNFWMAPRSHSTCFRPELPAGTILAIEGLAYLNCYVPIEVDSAAGDAGPFVDHVRRMLPVANDADLLLHYMASVVQNPGIKFQWWPLVQGVKGNGKTLLLSCMVAAVGSRYSHLVNPDAMMRTGNQFNSWIENKLFLGFEEILTGERRSLAETLKSTVTNRRLAMEGKGRDQTTVDNRANGMMLSNHKDAVPVDDDERRYGIFYCAQQAVEDLARDGMSGDYFPNLYAWLDAGGYAIVTGYLAGLSLEAALDPARGMHRAPHTSSTREAVTASYGLWEQEIIEAIEQGTHGFAGGFISSTAVTRLFQRRSQHIGPRKVREVLKAIGYYWHPALIDGRVNNPLPNEGRPRIYVRRDTPEWQLRSCADVVEAYGAAQNMAQMPSSNVVPIR